MRHLIVSLNVRHEQNFISKREILQDFALKGHTKSIWAAQEDRSNLLFGFKVEHFFIISFSGWQDCGDIGVSDSPCICVIKITVDNFWRETAKC